MQANDVIATDLRGFEQIDTVYINGGTATGNSYADNQFSGLFDDATIVLAAVFLESVVNNSVSGVFDDDNYDDIQVSSSTGVNIGPVSSFNAGCSVIFANLNSGLIIHNVAALNSGVNTSVCASNTASTISLSSNAVTSVLGTGRA